jgi:hypothetical protein
LNSTTGTPAAWQRDRPRHHDIVDRGHDDPVDLVIQQVLDDVVDMSSGCRP